MLEIDKGRCVSAKLHFMDEEVAVDMRRINNAAGHLQFRYERQQHQRLRDYFLYLAEQSNPENGCVVEITETKQGTFEVVPISGFKNNKPRLCIHRPVCHMVEQEAVNSSAEFREIVASVCSVEFRADHSQRDYNRLIQKQLAERGWSAEESVNDEIGLKCDFYKNGIWLEVEFGNARSYYQDYIKFLIAARFRNYVCGILLCPTSSFANYLCDLGRKRARNKGYHNVAVSYSGMMTHEKAIRELPCLEHILTERVVLAGVDAYDIFPHGPNAMVPDT